MSQYFFQKILSEYMGNMKCRFSCLCLDPPAIVIAFIYFRSARLENDVNSLFSKHEDNVHGIENVNKSLRSEAARSQVPHFLRLKS